MTSSEISARDLELAGIVDAFEDARRGDSKVTVEQWIELHPDHAEELGELLPGLLMMENAASAADASGGLVPRHEPAPERIGEYRILTQLGRGGMGVVYLAIHEPLQREVALKVLPTNLELGEAFLERFQREARVAAGLDHPNIVPAYAVGESEGRHFFAMRFIDGCSLDEVLRAMRGASEKDSSSSTSGRGSGDMASAVSAVRSMSSLDPLPDARRSVPTAISNGVSPRSAAEIALSLTRALAHAHGHGVLHRDIKPGNVLIDKSGRPFIADFGLCRVEEGGDLTGTQSVIGTLRYMAPEQVEGTADERSDVYSMGLVLFEMLTLRPAFDATRRTKLIHDILHQSVPKVSRFRKRVPRPLEVIVRKATAKLPEERYGSAQAMARDLSAFLEGRPIEATPPSSFYLAKLFVARHRLASATALLSLIALGILGVSYVRDLRASQLVAQRQAYIGDLAAAEAALREGSVVRAMNHLASAPERFRAWEWEHLMARADQSIGQVFLQKGWLRFATVSPTGDLVAVSGERGFSIVRLPSLEVACQFSHGATRGMAWDEEGKRLVVIVESRALVQYRVDSSGVAMEEKRDESRAARHGGPAVMARVGDRYLFGGGNQFTGRYGKIRAWDPAKGEITDAAELGGSVVALGELRGAETMSAISRDMRAAASEPGAFAWWALTALGTLTVHVGVKSERLDLEVPGEAVTSGVMIGDDMVIGTQQGGTLRYSMLDGGVPFRLPASAGKVMAVAATEDVILSAGADRRIRAFDRMDPSKPFDFSGSAHTVMALHWLPDQRRFISLSDEGQLRLWDLDVLGGGETLRAHLNDVGIIKFAPDGRRIVTGSREGLAFVWDALRSELIARLDGLNHSVKVASFVGDTDQVIGITERGDACLWDAVTGEILKQKDITDRYVFDGVWDPARGLLAIVTRGGITFLDSDLNWVGPVPEDLAEGLEDGVPMTRCLAWDPTSKSTVGLRIDGSLTLHRANGQVDITPPRQGVNNFSIGGISTGLPGTPSEGLAFFGFEEGKLAVVRIETGELVVVLADEASDGNPGEHLNGATVSPEGDRILATTKNGLVGVWTIEGEHLLDLRGHGDWALRMQTSPAIGVCVSASSEGSVRLWTTRSSRELAALRDSIEPLVPLARIAELQEEASAKVVLDRLEQSVIEDPAALPASEWTQLAAILRWQPENRRAPAIQALIRSANSTDKTWVPKLEQSMRDLPNGHRLQPHLAKALASLRLRLIRDAAGLGGG